MNDRNIQRYHIFKHYGCIRICVNQSNFRPIAEYLATCTCVYLWSRGTPRKSRDSSSEIYICIWKSSLLASCRTPFHSRAHYSYQGLWISCCIRVQLYQRCLWKISQLNVNSWWMFYVGTCVLSCPPLKSCRLSKTLQYTLKIALALCNSCKSWANHFLV